MTSTPRRSLRGQPVVYTDISSHKSLDSKYLLSDTPPLHIRPTAASDVPDDLSILETDLSNYETRFYSHFQKAVPFIERPVNVYGKPRSKVGRNVLTTNETFSVGDTVLVRTMSLEPSIAVITAIWTVTHLHVAGTGPPPLQVRIHWFVRPSQLARVRARREYHEVRCFSSFTIVCLLSFIL